NDTRRIVVNPSKLSTYSEIPGIAWRAGKRLAAPFKGLNPLGGGHTLALVCVRNQLLFRLAELGLDSGRVRRFGREREGSAPVSYSLLPLAELLEEVAQMLLNRYRCGIAAGGVA